VKELEIPSRRCFICKIMCWF